MNGKNNMTSDDYDIGYKEGCSQTATEITDSIVQHIDFGIQAREAQIKTLKSEVETLHALKHDINQKHRPK
ncbi:hypothetical protein HBA55_29405 [Pseudomaricurvus alkylphenolicus]|uniref:hypothetical protein n=1 Tax=Pseudomaricurvus alkylphenolicus TaxID=1306991 RepID=UPI0014234AF0|nr:hypothetical protein [Pseudomaricurvus alkylphenolicus]NIB43756.1 hypothetical protein [Pseudomaricurvus alkylphenolicus]